MTVRKLLLLLLLFGLTSCSVIAAQIGIPQVSSIAQIRSNPPIGWSIYLQGVVSDVAPMVGQQLYQLEDIENDSGKIWVLTKEKTVPLGFFKIRGIVRFESIQIDGQEQGEVYIEEQERLPATYDLF